MFAEIALPDTMVHEETSSTGALDGCALWVPPGEGQTGFLDTVSPIPRIASIFGRQTPGVLRGFAFMESQHPKGPHYYLWLLGVAAERQGRGSARP
jgi:hypothetical protein